MSLNKNDKEARNIDLEHAKWLDNSSNQIQEVEIQDGSKEANNLEKPKLSINSRTMKIIMGGVVLVIGIGIGSMMTKGSLDVSTDSVPSISSSMPSENQSAASMSSAEDSMNVHYFPDTLNYAVKQIDFSTFSEFDQVLMPDYDYADLDSVCDSMYIHFNFAKLVYRTDYEAINGAFLLREIDPSQKLYSVSYINMQAYLDNPQSVDNLLDTSITSVYDENNEEVITPIDLSHIEEENTILIPFVSTIGHLDVTSIEKKDYFGVSIVFDFSLDNVNNTIQEMLSINGLDVNFEPLQYTDNKTLVKCE